MHCVWRCLRERCVRRHQHTDRGSQHHSRERRALLDEHGLVASLSTSGNSYGSTAMESWKLSLKVEAIHGNRLIRRDSQSTRVGVHRGRLQSNPTPLHSGLPQPRAVQAGPSRSAGCPKLDGEIPPSVRTRSRNCSCSNTFSCPPMGPSYRSRQ